MEWLGALRKDGAHRAESVRVMFDAGVPVFAGSDAAGSAACWAGGALIEELELLVKAGLSTTQVKLAATVLPARWIDAKGDWGTVEAGARADLILVAGALSRPRMTPSVRPPTAQLALTEVPQTPSRWSPTGVTWR